MFSTKDIDDAAGAQLVGERLTEAEYHRLKAAFHAGVQWACEPRESSATHEGSRFREEVITVRTVWNYVGQVEQLVQTPTATMQRRVLNTMEAQTRDALVALGWTPPAK